MQLLRCWGHIDGYGTLQKVKYPIQLKPGVYNEVALRRYDFVLDALSKVHAVRICLVSREHCALLGWQIGQLPQAAADLYYWHVQAGIRIILSMTNFWHNLGGIQW